jgi:hypothetical protein
MGERHWPFPVKPEAEWAAHDRDVISFMRQAYAEGFRLREGAVSAIEAESPSGRSITLVFRGAGHGWEPFMSDGVGAVRLGPTYGLTQHGCVCIGPPFRHASHFALQWLRGNDMASMVAEYQLVGTPSMGRRNVVALRSASAQEQSGVA